MYISKFSILSIIHCPVSIVRGPFIYETVENLIILTIYATLIVWNVPLNRQRHNGPFDESTINYTTVSYRQIAKNSFSPIVVLFSFAKKCLINSHADGRGRSSFTKENPPQRNFLSASSPRRKLKNLKSSRAAFYDALPRWITERIALSPLIRRFASSGRAAKSK